MVTPDAQKEAVHHCKDSYNLSERQACKLIDISRSVYRYHKKLDGNIVLRKILRTEADKHKKYGCVMLYRLIRNKGYKVNHKRIERLYREENLALRRRKKKRKLPTRTMNLKKANKPGENWSIDFIHDALHSGRKFRVFGVIDTVSRESLELFPEFSITGKRVTELLDKISITRGLPDSINLDNGPEFTSKEMLEWAKKRKVTLNFSRPGKPTDNAYIESFFGRFREECLSMEWFLNLEDARKKIKLWQEGYNNIRPHGALGGDPPRVYALNFQSVTSSQENHLKTGTKNGV